MAFMSYVTIILNSILFLSRIFVMYSKASASARRISEVLNLPEDLMVEHPVGNVDSVVEKAVNEAEAAAAKETGAEFVLPQIIFDHVSFSYEDGDGEDCLHDVSFTVNKGETLGIIGATGSGKTTIVNLLMRYYDPDEGHIYVNGRDVRTYTSKELMPLFGAAFQNDVISMIQSMRTFALDVMSQRKKQWQQHRMRRLSSLLRKRDLMLCLPSGEWIFQVDKSSVF